MIEFIDDHRDRFGVEPICRVLREHVDWIAPNSYWVAKKRAPSARAVRDAELVDEIHRVYEGSKGRYGADKVWAQLNADGIRVARCTIERLMRANGWQGVRRGKTFKFTTRTDDRQQRPVDLVNRDFTAAAPNRLWVADITYINTLSGWVYAAFIIDVYSRLIVGWALSDRLHTSLALDALELAVWQRQRHGVGLDGLVHHTDAGVQYLSIRYSQRLADDHIVASVGTVGDSYDNAMAEAFNSLYKAELIHHRNPTWRGLDDVEFATLEYVHWYNHHRLHGGITNDNTYITPAAHDAAYYHHNQPVPELATQ